MRSDARGKEAVQKVRWLWLTGNDVESCAVAAACNDAQLTLEVA